MNRSSSSGSDHSAAQAFARVGWPKVWAKLMLYATGKLGFAPIDAESAGVVEAADLVHTLVERSLDGTLLWTLEESATDEQILGSACTKLYGMRSTLCRQAARTVYHDDCGEGALDERPDPGPDALAKLMVERGLQGMERLVEHDAEASAYLRGMLEGQKREEIMAALGCTAERADVVRKRILRTLAAHARRTNGDGEDGPPSG